MSGLTKVLNLHVINRTEWRRWQVHNFFVLYKCVSHLLIIKASYLLTYLLTYLHIRIFSGFEGAIHLARIDFCEPSYVKRLRKSKLQSLEHRYLINEWLHNLLQYCSWSLISASLKFSDFFKFSNTQITCVTRCTFIWINKWINRQNVFSSRVVKP